MNELNTQKLKQLELELFGEFIKICRNNGLEYFLINGSALGAVRHNGFIPWDDDIDVGMPRKDYTRFLEVAQNELSDGFFLQNYQTDKEYVGAYSKLRNSNTTFIETSVKDAKINHGVFMDIFPLDGCKDYQRHEKRARFLKLRIYMSYYQNKKRSLKYKVLSLFAKLMYLNCNTAVRKFDELNRRYSYEECDIIASYAGAWGKKEVMPKEIFGNGKMGIFEGIEVMLPENTHEYLTRLYGEYMTLPPKEEQVSHHYCEVIDLEKPYTSYVN